MSRHRFLTAEQVEALPEDVRAHYRENDWLRDAADLELFPEPVRSHLQALADRSRERAARRITEMTDAREHRAAS